MTEQESKVLETMEEQTEEIETVCLEPTELTSQETETAEKPEVRLEAESENVHKRGALIGAGVGVTIAVLLLTIGFWKTLLIGAMGGLGAFFGGVEDKQRWVRDFINQRFPPKD